MNNDTTYKRALALLRSILQKHVDETNTNQVAKRLKVPASTVQRWLDSTRGAEITLTKAIDIALILGLDVREVLMTLSPDLGPALVVLLDKEPEVFGHLIHVFENGDPDDIAKLKQDIAFLAKKTAK